MDWLRTKGETTSNNPMQKGKAKTAALLAGVMESRAHKATGQYTAKLETIVKTKPVKTKERASKCIGLNLSRFCREAGAPK